MLSSNYQRLLKISVWVASTGMMMNVVVTASNEIQTDLRQSWPYATDETARQLSVQETLDRLRKEPLHAPALRSLGLSRADRIPPLFLAHKATRRDPLTQLLLVEYAASEGDTSTALKHYNVLLETSPALREGIISILGRASLDRNVFRQLNEYSQSSWYAALLLRVVQETETNSDLVALIEEHPAITTLLLASSNTEQLERALIQKPDPENAFILFPEASIKAKESIAFDFEGLPNSQPNALFVWRFGKDIKPVQDESGQSRLEIDAPPNANTFIAQRYTDLDQGAYRLTGFLNAGNAAKLRLRIRIECVSSQRRIAINNDQIAPSVSGRPFDMAIAIPPNCSVQQWNISVLGDDSSNIQLVQLYGLKVTKN